MQFSTMYAEDNSDNVNRVYSKMSIEKAKEIFEENLSRFPSPGFSGAKWELPEDNLDIQGININKKDWLIFVSLELYGFTELGGLDIAFLPINARPKDMVVFPLGLFASTVDLVVIENECFEYEKPVEKRIKKGYYIIGG